MMYEISIQNVLSAVQTSAILVGIAYYVIVLNYTRRNQEQTLKTRELTLFSQNLGSIITNPVGMKYTNLVINAPVSSYEDFLEIVGTNPEFNDAFIYYCTCVEFAGLFIKEGVLDIRFFEQFQPWSIPLVWNKYKSIIQESRKMFGPTYYQNLEYLANSLEKYFEENPELAP